jgi:excisionase family DNA binding protein
MPRRQPSRAAQRPAPAEEPELDASDEEMLTTKEVARRLKVTSQTVQRLIGRGDLIAVRVGRDWRIAPSAFKAFLRKHQSG